MLVGTSPFASAAAAGNLAIFSAILSAPPLARIPVPRTGPAAAARAAAADPALAAAEELDFVRRLLCRDSIARLGCGREGAAEVRSHPWLARHIDFAALLAFTLPAPWRPACTTASDARYFEKFSDSESDGEGGPAAARHPPGTATGSGGGGASAPASGGTQAARTECGLASGVDSASMSASSGDPAAVCSGGPAGGSSGSQASTLAGASATGSGKAAAVLPWYPGF